MRKAHRRLQRELTRHLVATAIAAALVLAAIVTSRLITGDDLTMTEALAQALALVFGAYGPAFLWLSHLAFRRLTGDQLRARLRRSEERSRLLRLMYLGGPKTWAITIVAVGVASVVGLASGRGAVDIWLVATCVTGIGGTWVLMVAIFAVEHMRGWAEHDGLRFPGDEERDFSDFLYLSIHLSTTFSTADVALTKRAARRLASVQSIVGFAYSTIVIAVFASLLITLAV